MYWSCQWMHRFLSFCHVGFFASCRHTPPTHHSGSEENWNSDTRWFKNKCRAPLCFKKMLKHSSGYLRLTKFKSYTFMFLCTRRKNKDVLFRQLNFLFCLPVFYKVYFVDVLICSYYTVDKTVWCFVLWHAREVSKSECVEFVYRYHKLPVQLFWKK